MVARAMQEFRLPVRVYYEDTDAAGVVYYANYLRYMERARTEWLAALGFDLAALELEHGIVFAVRRVDIEYRLPARLGDRLDVTLALLELAMQGQHHRPRNLLEKVPCQLVRIADAVGLDCQFVKHGRKA